MNHRGAFVFRMPTWELSILGIPTFTDSGHPDDLASPTYHPDIVYTWLPTLHSRHAHRHAHRHVVRQSYIPTKFPGPMMLQRQSRQTHVELAKWMCVSSKQMYEQLA